MSIVKNTFGVSLVLSPKLSDWNKLDTFGGSSVDRVKTSDKPKKNDQEKLSEFDEIKKDKEIKLRSMSKRTKSKIRIKLMAFAQVQEKLSFAHLRL